MISKNFQRMDSLKGMIVKYHGILPFIRLISQIQADEQCSQSRAAHRDRPNG
jgi:hypothetical protein